MSKPMNDQLLLALAERAKKSMYAMRACFGRDPDVADFLSEFREEVEHQEYLSSIKSNESQKATMPTPSNPTPTQESERKYPKFSPEQPERMLEDLKRYLKVVELWKQHQRLLQQKQPE